MKLIYLIQKAWIQQTRDKLSLILLISTTPILFLLYYSITLGESKEFLTLLILLSVIMVVFSSSIVVAKEIESKTIIRLILAEIPYYQGIIGLCLVQFFLSIISILFTFIFFYFYEIYNIEILIKFYYFAIINSLTSIWIGASVGSLTRNTFKAFTISSLLMFLLLLLSGALFPIPRKEILLLHTIHLSLFDLIPSNLFLQSIYSILESNQTQSGILLLQNSLLSFFYFVVAIAFFQISKTKKVNDEL